MNQVLLLTKNIFMDNEWITRIQQLGYEVLCSSQLLENILIKHDLSAFSFFQIVIFSESVANEEVLNILNTADTSRVAFLRIENGLSTTSSLKNEEEQYSLGFLSSSMELTEIREALVSFRKKTTDNLTPLEKKNFEKSKIPVPVIAGFISSLSQKEKALFDILYQEESDFVSRTELSGALWHKEVSNSTLTQLSQIIGRVKRKMLNFGMNEDLIKTHWNKGYALDPKICESIAKYVADERMIQGIEATN